MIKISINGQEIQLPDELKPIVENMVRSNMGKISEQVNQITNQPFPFMHPRLRGMLTQEKCPMKDILKEIGLEINKPTISYPQHRDFQHRGKCAMAIFDIDEKVRDLEKRIANIEDILIRKQLEEERENIKPLVKKKVVLTITKPMVKKVVADKPIVKKVIPVKPIVKKVVTPTKPVVKKVIPVKPVVKKVVTPTKPVVKKVIPVKPIVKKVVTPTKPVVKKVIKGRKK